MLALVLHPLLLSTIISEVIKCDLIFGVVKDTLGI